VLANAAGKAFDLSTGDSGQRSQRLEVNTKTQGSATFEAWLYLYPGPKKWMKVLRAEEVDGIAPTEKGNYFELFVIQEEEGIKLQLATSWSTTQEVCPLD